MGDSIAIAHKDYQVRGGGERFVEVLANELGCPLFIGGSHEDVALGYGDTREVETTRAQHWMVNRGGVLRSVAYMAAWENEDRLAKYDTIITSGNEPLWYVGKPEQTHIAYCHSPPRVLYDLNHGTGVGTLGALLRVGQRTLFQHNVPRPDLWVANSEIVARRIKHYLNGEPVRVVYPPVKVSEFCPTRQPTESYYLYLGRLAHHKRVEWLVDAFQDRPNDQLIIAGRGPREDKLREQASSNVEFFGYVDEREKRDLLSEARALLFPAEAEDFGIVPIEALASGTPVLAYKEGFTQHQIRDGVNGILLDPGQDFTVALDRFEDTDLTMTPEEMAKWAGQFNVDRFASEMREIVANTDTEIQSTGVKWDTHD